MPFSGRFFQIRPNPLQPLLLSLFLGPETDSIQDPVSGYGNWFGAGFNLRSELSWYQLILGLDVYDAWIYETDKWKQPKNRSHSCHWHLRYRNTDSWVTKCYNCYKLWENWDELTIISFEFLWFMSIIMKSYFRSIFCKFWYVSLKTKNNSIFFSQQSTTPQRKNTLWLWWLSLSKVLPRSTCNACPIECLSSTTLNNTSSLPLPIKYQIRWVNFPLAILILLVRWQICTSD